MGESRQWKRIFLALASAFVLACSCVLPTTGAAYASETDNSDAKSLTVSSSLQTAASSTVKSDDLVNGHVYIIRPVLSTKYAVDVVGRSKANGTNIQLYKSNRTTAQQWKYTVDSNGYAKFVCVGTGKALAANGGKTSNGTNVLQRKSTSAMAQKWKVTKLSSGAYTIATARKSSQVLTVAGNKKGNCTNIEIRANSKLKGQKWVFYDVTEMRARLKAQAKKSAKKFAGKTYYISSEVGKGMVLGVTGKSKASGANVRLYRASKSSAKRWTITFNSAGYATIKNGSGKVLGVKGGAALSGTDVRQYKYSNSRAKKWIISKNSDGTYTIKSALWENLALDVKGASSASGTNVRLYTANGTDAQKWTFSKKVPSSLSISAEIESELSGIDLTGVKAVGIDVSVWNGSIDWKKVAAAGIDFVIIRCGFGDNYKSQDDARFYEYVTGAKAAGLDLGVYLYSYAQRTTGSESAASEAAHTLRLLKSAGLRPTDLKYGVSYDIEDGSQASLNLLPLCKKYCNKITAAGYSANVYSYLYWWNTKLTESAYNKWGRYVAQWGVSSCQYAGTVNIWQCTSSATIPGISGNVDMDLAY